MGDWRRGRVIRITSPTCGDCTGTRAMNRYGVAGYRAHGQSGGRKSHGETGTGRRAQCEGRDTQGHVAQRAECDRLGKQRLNNGVKGNILATEGGARSCRARRRVDEEDLDAGTNYGRVDELAVDNGPQSIVHAQPRVANERTGASREIDRVK